MDLEVPTSQGPVGHSPRNPWVPKGSPPGPPGGPWVLAPFHSASLRSRYASQYEQKPTRRRAADLAALTGGHEVGSEAELTLRKVKAHVSAATSTAASDTERLRIAANVAADELTKIDARSGGNIYKAFGRCRRPIFMKIGLLTKLGV